MKIGELSEYFSLRFLALFILQFILVIVLVFYKTYGEMANECLKCHSDKDKMNSLGYPHLVVTQKDVENQSGHKNIRCQDCHLGDASKKDKDKAHKGMLSAFYVNTDGSITKRTQIKMPLIPSGNDEIRDMLPLDNDNIRNILWHDRDKTTFNYSPDIVKKTCGRSGCHPQEFKQFNSTIMGTNYRQRTMKTWLIPYGPHNCGPSFADLPPSEKIMGIGFDFKNTAEIQKEINIPFSHQQAMDKQRFCNVCHAGCLDCHYEPSKTKGIHNINARPSSRSCGGYGRGTSICHPGAMQSRRGETYIGGDYSIPTGMVSDTHYLKGIHCADCHHTGKKGMGDMVRKAGCQDCHFEIEEAHSKSVHKNLDCATCHVPELRGYQIVIWGEGNVANRRNPFKKYSLYYGIQRPPIIMKDKTGRWMPIKVMPHSLSNFKTDVKPSDSIMFRWQNDETRDAYYILGTFDIKDKNKHLLWVELQQASHPYTKARSCDSCHINKQQISISRWQYMDYQGVENPFGGEYKIIADEKGLKITDMILESEIKVSDGYKLEDFASWIFFKDKWHVPGDFSIKTDREKYQRLLKTYKDVSARIEYLSKSDDKNKKMELKHLKTFIMHNLDYGSNKK
ncbi:MAG: cytochrome c3 family protein [Thermodesulfovibrionales bacterium]|nr:cytochrome c3 family protein [Thermodesulfovibrionales bacterium]